MIRVRQVIPLKRAKAKVLVCDLFPDQEIRSRLKVGKYLFEKEQFHVEEPKACFSAPVARHIVIMSEDAIEEAKEIEFR